MIKITILSITALASITLCAMDNNSLAREAQITPFDTMRDSQDVCTIFEQNRAALTTRPEFDIKKVIGTLAIDYDKPENHGSLTLEVVRHNDKVIGFAAYQKDATKSTYLRLLAIESAHQQKGFKLMTHLFENRRNALDEKKLYWGLRTTNPAAVALYKKLERAYHYGSTFKATLTPNEQFKQYNVADAVLCATADFGFLSAV